MTLIRRLVFFHVGRLGTVFLLFLLPVIAARTTWADDWPQLQGGPGRLGYSAEAAFDDAPALRRAWAHGFAPERLAPQAQPVVAGGRVFIGTAMGTFYAFDARAGAVAWKRQVGGPVLHTAGVEGGRVFFGCMDGSVYALDAAGGDVAWKFDSGLRTGFSSAVLLAGGRAFIANRGGAYFALSQADGSVAWRTDLGAPVLMSSAYADGRLFVGAMDLRVYALDADTGKVLWKSKPLAGAALKDYWPVAHRGRVLVRPARASGYAYGKAIEWHRGPLPQSELDKQEEMVGQAAKDPSLRNLYVLDAKTGEESIVLPQWVTNTMNGATAPPCVDGDGLLVVPVTLHDWRGGWGRLDLERGRVAEVLCDGDFDFFKQRNTMRGTGNPDENLAVSAAGRVVFTLHTQEMNAHFNGSWHLDRRAWTQLPPVHADTSFSGNTQGGGGTPGVVSGGMLYHTSWNTLNARAAAPKAAPEAQRKE